MARSKYPRVDGIEFVFWADADDRFERIPDLQQKNEYEEARWEATIDGTECVVVGYCSDKLGNDMRLVVQGSLKGEPKSDQALKLARQIAREFRAAQENDDE